MLVVLDQSMLKLQSVMHEMAVHCWLLVGVVVGGDTRIIFASTPCKLTSAAIDEIYEILENGKP